MVFEGLDQHESVRAARAMVRRTLALWALDALRLRGLGYDRAGHPLTGGRAQHERPCVSPTGVSGRGLVTA